jgi:hypothetical protein
MHVLQYCTVLHTALNLMQFLQIKKKLIFTIELKSCFEIFCFQEKVVVIVKAFNTVGTGVSGDRGPNGKLTNGVQNDVSCSTRPMIAANHQLYRDSMPINQNNLGWSLKIEDVWYCGLYVVLIEDSPPVSGPPGCPKLDVVTIQSVLKPNADGKMPKPRTKQLPKRLSRVTKHSWKDMIFDVRPSKRSPVGNWFFTNKDTTVYDSPVTDEAFAELCAAFPKWEAARDPDQSQAEAHDSGDDESECKRSKTKHVGADYDSEDQTDSQNDASEEDEEDEDEEEAQEKRHFGEREELIDLCDGDEEVKVKVFPMKNWIQVTEKLADDAVRVCFEL